LGGLDAPPGFALGNPSTLASEGHLMRSAAMRHDFTASQPLRHCPTGCSSLCWATARSALLLLGLAAALPTAAFAQTTYTWSGGDGTWAVGTDGWDAGNWATGKDAVFAGTPGTVTVSDGIAPASTTIDVAGYTFTPGAGLVDWGSGEVAINADVTFVGGTDRNFPQGPWTGTGDVTVSGGGNRRVILANNSTNWTGDLTIEANTVLQSGYGVSIAGTTVTNDGELRVLNGSLTIGGLAGSGVVTNGSSLTVGGLNTDTTFSGAIQNTVPLTKTGTGTLTLSGASTSTGTVTISGGTLQIGDGGTTGSVAASITNNATLAFNRSDALTVSNVISGTGVVSQTGSGTLSLTGTNTYSGGTSVTAGILGFSGQASIPDWGTPGAVTVGAGGALAVGNDTSPDDAVGYLDPASGLGFDTSAGDRTWSTAITGTRPFVKAGANTLTLTAVNTHSGLTTIGAGTLELQSNADQTLSGGLSGGGTLRKSGTGSLTLSAASSYSGDTTVSAGTLILNNSTAAGSGTITLGDAATDTSDVQLTLGTNIDRSGFTNAITVANQGTGTATIKWIETGVTGNPSTGSGQITLGRATIFDATQLAGGAYLFNHALSGSGDLSLTGTNGVRFLLQAASSGYTGNITVESGGIFEPRNYLSSATGNNVTVDSGGELRIQFVTSSIGGLNGDGIVQSVSRAATLSVGKNNASGSFAGILRNNGTVLSFTKTGTGTQVLSGTNTYSGETRITAGGLRATEGVGLPTASLLTLNGDAATLQTSGTFNREMGAAAGQVRLTGAGGTGVGFSAVDGPLVVDLQQNGGGGTATWTIGQNPAANQVNISNLLLNDASATDAIEFRNNWNFGGGTRRIRVTATAVGTAATASGVLSNGNFEKTGAGTLVLSGNNTHGNTRILAGTLEAAANTALGTGTVTVDAGTTLLLSNYATVANTITGAGTVAYAGGGVRRTSSEALTTVAGVVAGTAASPVARSGTFDPTVAWSPQVAGTTYSDVLGLTNTAGTVQILEIAYDPATLGSIAPADLFLGWDDNGAWVNAIDGNTGSVGGLAVFNQTGSLTSLGILATSDYLGSWGRDTTANTVWAVIDHNSDFAVIAVPEPGTLVLAGAAATVVALACRRRRTPPEA